MFNIIILSCIVGGTRYTAQFTSSSNDIFLATRIYCSDSDERIQDCSISHYTHNSSCDALSIVAVRYHSEWIFLAKESIIKNMLVWSWGSIKIIIAVILCDLWKTNFVNIIADINFYILCNRLYRWWHEDCTILQLQ